MKTVVGEIYLCSHDSDGEPILLKNFKGVKVNRFCGGYNRAFILEEGQNSQAKIHSLHPPEFDDYDFTFTEKNLEDLAVTQKEVEAELKARYQQRDLTVGQDQPPRDSDPQRGIHDDQRATGYSAEREAGRKELSAVREDDGEHPEAVYSEEGGQQAYEDYASRDQAEDRQEADPRRVSGHLEEDPKIGSTQTDAATKIYSAFDGKGTIVELRSGRNHILLLNAEGEVYSYGYGEYGVMGRGGTDVHSSVPMKISNLKAQKIVKVTCGYQHCLALNTTGDIYSWGRGFEGQLGLKLSNAKGPSESGTEEYPANHVDGDQVDEGSSMGNSTMKQSRVKAGPYSEPPLRVPVQLECSSIPRVVRYFTKKRYDKMVKEEWRKSPAEQKKEKDFSEVIVEDIECGAYHSLALTKSGDLFGWGDSGCGQLGVGRLPKVWVPVQIPVKEKVAQMAAGFAHTVITTREGFVYSFGLNHKFQLGFDDQKSRFKPERLLLDDNGLTLNRILKIACGDYNCFALSQLGEVYSWGSGVLGIKEIAVLTRPKIIRGIIGDKQITDIYVNNGNAIFFTPLKVLSMKPSCGPSSGGTIFSILGVGLCDMGSRQRIRFVFGNSGEKAIETGLRYDENTNSYYAQTPNFEFDGQFDAAQWPTRAKVSISLDGEKWMDADTPFFIYSSRMRISNISPKFASIEGGLEMCIELITDQKTMKEFSTVSVGFQATVPDVRTDAQKLKAKEEERVAKKDEVKVLNPIDLPLNSPELEKPDWIYFEGSVRDKDVVFQVPPHSKLVKNALFYNIDVSLNGQQFLGTPSFFRYYQVEVEKIEPDVTVRLGGTKITISGKGFIDSLQKKIKLVNSKVERMIDVKWEKVEEYYYFFTPPISWLSGKDDDLSDLEAEELMREKVKVFITISGKDWIPVGSYVYYEPKLRHMIPGPAPDKQNSEEAIREHWLEEEPILEVQAGLSEKEAEKKRVEHEKKLKEDLAEIENVFRKPGSFVFIEGEQFLKKNPIFVRLTFKQQNWDTKAAYKNHKRLGFEVPLIEGPPEGVHEFAVSLSFDGGQNFCYQGLKLRYFCFNKDTPDIERNKLMDAELKQAKKAGKK